MTVITTERHAVGERLLISTRAEEALARPGEHVTALRALMSELLKNEEMFRHIVQMVTSVDIRYQMGNSAGEEHDLTGRWTPNLVLALGSGTKIVSELMRAGKGAFIDLADRESLRRVTSRWRNRIRVIAGRCYGHPAKLDPFLIRPGGYVCSAAMLGDRDEDCERTLTSALHRWFGDSTENTRSQENSTSALVGL